MFKLHSFFPFLNSWLSFLFCGFAAGAVANPGEAIADAITGGGGGEIDTEDDFGGGEGEHVEGEDIDLSEGGGEDVEGQKTVQATKGVSPEAKQHIAELKATNPKLAKQLQADLHAGWQARKSLHQLTEHFPAGVKDVLALKSQIEEKLGSMDGLEELGQEINNYRELDALWGAKDPRLAAVLADSYPDEFAEMVPHFLTQFAKSSPEAYNKQYAGMVMQEISAQNIPQALYLIDSQLKTVFGLVQDSTAKGFIKQAYDVVQGINAWLKELGTTASAKVAPKQGPGNVVDPKQQQRENAVAQRELAVFNREVTGDYNPWRDNLIDEALQRILTHNKKELTAEQRDDLKLSILNRLSQKMNEVPKFREQCAKFTNAKDKAGLLRFVKSRAKEALLGANGKPGVISQSYRLRFGKAVLNGKGNEQQGGKGKANGTPAADAGKDWIRVAKRPENSAINWTKTSMADRMANRYYLNDGKKVVVKAAASA